MRRADGTIAEGAPAWTPPAKPSITVIARLKEDPLGRMFARHQIDESQFRAGRGYQEVHDASQIGGVRSVNLERTRVSGGLPAEPLTEHRRKAASKLRSIEATVARRYGEVGVGLCRIVLGDRRPVEQAARMAGAVSSRQIRSWGWLFRKILDQCAVALGYASSARRPRSVVEPADPAIDPARRADADELADARLRRGRPNGGV